MCQGRPHMAGEYKAADAVMPSAQRSILYGSNDQLSMVNDQLWRQWALSPRACRHSHHNALLWCMDSTVVFPVWKPFGLKSRATCAGNRPFGLSDNRVLWHTCHCSLSGSRSAPTARRSGWPPSMEPARCGPVNRLWPPWGKSIQWLMINDQLWMTDYCVVDYQRLNIKY